MKFQNGMTGTHNGKVTIHNPATGQHRTFQIRTQPQDARFAPGQRIVALLNGPDNQSDYQPFGFVTSNGIKVWRKKEGTVFQTYAKMLDNPEAFQAKGAEYLFSGKCRKCNRELTVPESIKSGIGPVCAGK